MWSDAVTPHLPQTEEEKTDQALCLCVCLVKESSAGRTTEEVLLMFSETEANVANKCHAAASLARNRLNL